MSSIDYMQERSLTYLSTNDVTNHVKGTKILAATTYGVEIAHTPGEDILVKLIPWGRVISLIYNENDVNLFLDPTIRKILGDVE